MVVRSVVGREGRKEGRKEGRWVVARWKEFAVAVAVAVLPFAVRRLLFEV